MRIIPITINPKNTIITNSHIQNKRETQNVGTNKLLMTNTVRPYWINFKGYKEDVEFLNNAESSLDNMLNCVDFIIRNNFKEDNNKYYDALNILKNNEEPYQEIYEKIISSSFVFNKLEKDFEIFNNLILESIEDVKHNEKHFTQYWENNCKIGNEKTKDIINNCVQNPNANINSVLKNSSDKDFSKIKEELIKKWFKFAYENIEKNQESNSLKQNIKELEKLESTGQEDVTGFIAITKFSLTNSFNNNTKEKILSSNTTTAEKTAALEYLLSFIQAKLLEDKGCKLEQDFEILNNVKKQLQFAKEKESILFARNAINSLHSLAFEKWEKDNLNTVLNLKIKKKIFIKKEEPKNPSLRFCQNYPNFNIDEKYFVSRYFNTRYKTNSKYEYDDKDYLWQIVNDRNNTVTAQKAVQEMIYSIKNNQDSYFEKLDAMYDLLKERKYHPEISLPERKVESPDDDLSFCDLYINKLGKYNKFKKRSESEKLDYLSKLTLSEISLLNIDLKNDWLKNIQPYAIIEEVNRQARNTSIFINMFKELKNINENLTEIKIKANDISLSLKDALTNSATFSNLITDETPIKLSQQISDFQRTYNCLPVKAKENIDENFMKAMPEIQKVLSANKVDKELEETLLALSKVQNEKNPTNKFLNILQHFLIYRTLGEGLNSGSTLTKNLLNKVHTSGNIPLNFADNIDTQVFSDFASMFSSFTTPDAISTAAPNIAIAGAVGNSGALKSIMTAAASHPAIAFAAIATAICGGLIMTGANQAGKLERGQRNLVFPVEIEIEI